MSSALFRRHRCLSDARTNPHFSFFPPSPFPGPNSRPYSANNDNNRQRLDSGHEMIFHRHSRIFSSSSSHVIPTLSHVHSPPRTHVVTPPPRCNSPFLPVSFSLSLSLPLFFFTTFSSRLSYPSFYSSLRSPLSFSLCLSLLPSARFGPCRRQPRKRGTTDRKREGRERERERRRMRMRMGLVVER